MSTRQISSRPRAEVVAEQYPVAGVEFQRGPSLEPYKEDPQPSWLSRALRFLLRR